MNPVLRLIAHDLQKRVSPEKIDAAFQSIGPVTSSIQSACSEDDVCVCALQMEATMYSGMIPWLRVLDNTLAKAVSQGAQLVCLPEFYGMTPYFFSSLLRLIVRAMSHMPANSSETGGTHLYDILAPFSFMPNAYEAVLSRFSARYRIWLSAGTYLAPEQGHVYNRHVLFSPDGTVLGRQDKIHLTKEERELGLSAGKTLTVIQTSIGSIALSVCMDATYFETFRIARRLGADYMIVPIGDMAQFSPWLALRGAQSRVSETGLPAIKAALVSSPGFPATFSGKAGIYFPLGCGFDNVETNSPAGQNMALTHFRLSELRAANTDPFVRNNPAFDHQYFEELTAAAEHRRSEYIDRFLIKKE